MNTNTILNEDYTAGVLAGIPFFCINRLYRCNEGSMALKVQYEFTFDNGYGASIVEFHDKMYSGGAQYELAVLRDDRLVYDTYITSDVERGNEKYMHELLNKIEQLNQLPSS